MFLFLDKGIAILASANIHWYKRAKIRRRRQTVTFRVVAQRGGVVVVKEIMETSEIIARSGASATYVATTMNERFVVRRNLMSHRHDKPSNCDVRDMSW